MVNFQGQRVKKIDNNNSANNVNYMYDETGELIGEYTDTGTAKTEYVQLNEKPLAVLRDSNLYYVYPDHLGTPRAITDTSNNLVWTWENKEVFGNSPPNDTISGSLFTFNLRLPGQYYDTESGNNYNGFRDYNSKLGRYMQSDPLGLSAGINTYGYVGGNSLSRRDKNGLWSTAGHDNFISNMFPGMDAKYLDAMKAGSAKADSALDGYQLPINSFMHAMTSSSVGTLDSNTRMCGFIKAKMGEYQMYMKAGMQKEAFYQLGMALHPVMDSTSPAHQGYQYWSMSHIFQHGIWPSSLENKRDITPAILQNTLKKMNDVFRGDYSSCGCP